MKRYSTPHYRTVAIGVLGLAMISGVYAVVTADTSFSVGLPSCRSAAALAEVKNVVANLPGGNASGVDVVDLRDQQTVAQSAEKVSCSARALLKDGQTVLSNTNSIEKTAKF
jgi:hypothetical protein